MRKAPKIGTYCKIILIKKLGLPEITQFEIPFYFENTALSLSEDGINYRHWTPDEIVIVKSLYFNNEVINDNTSIELKINTSYICKMENGYIKLCFWNGTEWLDMWSDSLNGKVIDWMNVPKNF